MKAKQFRFAVLKLCAVLVGVFAVQATTEFDPAFAAGESPAWKFFASFLAHGGVDHLLNNLFFIGLFGSVYERMTSAETAISTFLVAAVAANLGAFVFFPGVPVIGASGGAFGLLAALAVYRPTKIGLALGVPMPMWAVLVAYTAIQFAGLSTGGSSTAFEAHLVGAGVGAAIGLQLRSIDPLPDGTEDESDREDSNWRQRMREWEEEYML